MDDEKKKASLWWPAVSTLDEAKSAAHGGAGAACLLAVVTLGASFLALPTFANASDRAAERAVVAAQSAAARTTDDVRRVIDNHKGKIYALYTRALRVQPYLEGKIVLSITIAPDGKVTKCALVSSTLHHAELEKSFVEHISSIDFGAKGTKVYFDPAFEMSFISTAGLRND